MKFTHDDRSSFSNNCQWGSTLLATFIQDNKLARHINIGKIKLMRCLPNLDQAINF